MKTTTAGWVLALALATTLPPPLPAGEAVDPAPKKARAARDEGRAAKNAAPDREAADGLTDAEFNAKVRATARAAFVTVHVTFRKDPAELQGSSSYHTRFETLGPEDLARELAHRFVDDQRPLDLPGLWLDPRGTVLVTDLGLPTTLLDRIEVRTGDGKAFPAKPKAVLRDTPGWLLAVESPGPFPAPAFADPGAVGPDSEFTAAWIEEIDGTWSISFGMLGGATLPLSGAPGPSWLLLGNGGSGDALRPPAPWIDAGDASGLIGRPLHLLFDDAAVPIGVALHERLPLDPASPAAWRGPAVQHDPAVTFDALGALERRLAASADAQVAEIKLTFRMDAPEDDGDFGGGGSPAFLRDPFSAGEGGREMTVYGLAVTPRRLFVPSAMNEAAAARIERIEVSLPGREAPVPGRFLGAFAEFAGFLVETERDLATPPPDLFAVESLPRVRPIPTLRVIRKYGQRTPVFGYVRLLDRQHGYQHRLVEMPDPPQAPGTFLFDLEGRPAGFVARLRRDDEKVRSLRNADRGGFASWESGMHAEDNRLYLFRDVREALANPAAAFDPDIRVKTKFEERRLAWLGVEYCLLNRELTRQLGIEGPTKSGQVGLMVVDVYDGSPARRLGLKDGDILLKIRKAGDREPIEFRFGEGEYGGFGRRFAGMPSQESEEELWLAEPPWHSQRTPLNLLLTSIGKGKAVTLTWLADGKETSAELALEEGPPDYESTERKKHEPTGLTVRGLTYEVRRALKMPPDAPGVVVSRVEEGSPAAVAKVNPYDVIQRIEGKEVESPAGIVEALETARAAGIASVKVQTLRLNRTRFVDLRFDVPADKAEGPRAGPEQ